MNTRAVFAIACLSFGAHGAHGGEKPRAASIRDAVSRLASTDLTIREKAQDEVVRAGETAVPAVLEALGKATDGVYVRELCWSLYMIGPAARAAAPKLESLLGARPPADRFEIAMALANVDPEHGKAAVPELGRCALDRSMDPWQRTACARELGDLDVTAGAPALVSALAEPEASVRASAAHALRSAPPETSRSPLLARLDDPALAVRVRAASSLLLGVPDPPPAALQTLIAGLCPGTPEDADVVASALEYAPVEATAGAADLLAPKLAEPSCRTWAAIALGRVDVRRALPALPALREALKSEDRLLRGNAAWTIGMLGSLAIDAAEDLDRAAEADPILKIPAARVRRPPARAPLSRIDDLRLVGTGKRENEYVAYFVQAAGNVWEMRKGGVVFDGEFEGVDAEGVDFKLDSRRDGTRVTPTRKRIPLFAQDPAPLTFDADATGEPLNLNFEGDVASLVKLMGDFSGLTVVLEAGTRGPVRIAARNAPWDGAMKRAFAEGGFDYKVDRGALRFGTREQVQKMRPLSSREYTGQPVSISFHGAEMEDIVKLFTDISGLAIELAPGLEAAPVTMHARDVPWDQVFDLICASRGWSMRLEGDKIRVTRH